MDTSRVTNGTVDILFWAKQAARPFEPDLEITAHRDLAGQ